MSSLWQEWLPHRIGNRLFIDFVNTAYRESTGHDPVAGWPDLLEFLRLTGALSDPDLTRLTHLSSGRTRTAEKTSTVTEARRLRSALKAMIEAVISGKQVRSESADAINHVLAAGDGHLRLHSDGSHWHLDRQPASVGPRLALVPIAYSAAEFLANDDLRRLRRCAGPGCVLYFYDTSRTCRRRWCRMELCGNRVKVHAHLERRSNRKRRARAGH